MPKKAHAPHRPTEASRRMVERLSYAGETQADIAALLGVSHKTLTRHYRDQLAEGEHRPTDDTRQTVLAHAMIGTTQGVIADLLGLDEKTLRKYYREELDHGLTRANAVIGGKLFNKAKAGDTASIFFWLKTRAGFRETNRTELTNPDGSMRFPSVIEVVGQEEPVPDGGDGSEPEWRG